MNRHFDVYYHPCQHYILASSSLETCCAFAFEKMLFAPLSRKRIWDMKTLIQTEQAVNILLILQGSVNDSGLKCFDFPLHSVDTFTSAVLPFDKLIKRIRAWFGIRSTPV